MYLPVFVSAILVIQVRIAQLSVAMVFCLPILEFATNKVHVRHQIPAIAMPTMLVIIAKGLVVIILPVTRVKCATTGVIALHQTFVVAFRDIKALFVIHLYHPCLVAMENPFLIPLFALHTEHVPIAFALAILVIRAHNVSIPFVTASQQMILLCVLVLGSAFLQINVSATRDSWAMNVTPFLATEHFQPTLLFAPPKHYAYILILVLVPVVSLLIAALQCVSVTMHLQHKFVLVMEFAYNQGSASAKPDMLDLHAKPECALVSRTRFQVFAVVMDLVLLRPMFAIAPIITLVRNVKHHLATELQPQMHLFAPRVAIALPTIFVSAHLTGKAILLAPRAPQITLETIVPLRDAMNWSLAMGMAVATILTATVSKHHHKVTGMALFVRNATQIILEHSAQIIVMLVQLAMPRVPVISLDHALASVMQYEAITLAHCVKLV